MLSPPVLPPPAACAVVAASVAVVEVALVLLALVLAAELVAELVADADNEPAALLMLVNSDCSSEAALSECPEAGP